MQILRLIALFSTPGVPVPEGIWLPTKRKVPADGGVCFTDEIGRRMTGGGGGGCLSLGTAILGPRESLGPPVTGDGWTAASVFEASSLGPVKIEEAALQSEPMVDAR